MGYRWLPGPSLLRFVRDARRSALPAAAWSAPSESPGVRSIIDAFLQATRGPAARLVSSLLIHSQAGSGKARLSGSRYSEFLMKPQNVTSRERPNPSASGSYPLYCCCRFPFMPDCCSEYALLSKCLVSCMMHAYATG